VSQPSEHAIPVPTADDEPPSGLPIDWALARRTAARLVSTGPDVEPVEAAQLVARLRTDAATAEGHVRDVTGLGVGLPLLPADVVDRPGWTAAAVHGMAALTAGARVPALAPPPAPGGVRGTLVQATRTVASTTAGLQVGGLVAFLGSRVLGQYDPFGGPDAKGRLLLVAPNVHAAQRALDVPADEFGLWVCLHEATHRLQFTAVPWLRDYFADEIATFLTVSAFGMRGGMMERLPEVAAAVRKGGADSLVLVELLQGPEQRAVLDRLLALTTLLEGHADHVMDAAGPDVVPSVATIRERFAARRHGGGLIDRLLRALLGVEAKVRQYAVGAAFTNHVVGAVGMEGFNRVWASPDTLPSRAELNEPDTWLRRVA